MAKTSPRLKARLRRKLSIRKRLSGTAERPRLSVFRSASHIYAQLVDDVAGVTLASASTLSDELKDTKNGGNIAAATAVGTLIAAKAQAANVNTVVFDRNGYLFHGRIAALAAAAREGGLQF